MSKIIYVKWCDANSNAEWFSIDEAKEWGQSEEWEVESVGFLIEETEEYILIAQRLSGDVCGALLKIPTTWIRERKELK